MIDGGRFDSSRKLYERLADVEHADWCNTAHGRLTHIADRNSGRARPGGYPVKTFCGRFAFSSADAPWTWWRGAACERCVNSARRAPQAHRQPEVS